MSQPYRRLLKLLEQWPIEKTKQGRDLGEYLRKQANSFIKPDSITTDISVKLEKQLASLERLANNTYGRTFQRTSTSTATGLNAEQCNQVLSSEFLQYLNDDKEIFKSDKN